MNKLYIRNVLTGLSFLIVLCSAITNTGGPGGGLTNAPNEGNCTSCHSSSIITSGNNNLNNIRLNGGFTGNGYIPDSTYTMVLTFKQTGKSKHGFQVTCLDNTNSPCGTLTNLNSRTSKVTAVVNSQTRQYIEHTSSGTTQVATDSNRWVFEWKAPSSNLGKVKFYVVINATNSNSSADAGDIIYGKVFEISPSNLLPVANATSLDSVTCTNYTVNLKGSGTNSPTSYSWKLTGGNPINSNAQNPTVTYGLAGTKQAILTVKNSKGTSRPDTLNIIVNGSPAAIIMNGSAASICKGDSLLVSANTGTNLTYLWSHNNKTTKTTYVKDPGAINVKVTGPNGCVNTSANFTLSHYTDPSITISKGSTNDTFCDSYSETLTASGSLIDSVHWYVNGVLTKRTKTLTTVFAGSNNANITAIAKSSTGCKSAVSNTVKIITVPKLLTSNFVSSKTTSTISLDWTNASGITGTTYSLNKVNYNPTTTDTSLLLTGLQPNTSYDITIRSAQKSPCLFSETTITVKTNACSNLSYVVDLAPRACKGSVMTATIKQLYKSKYSISFNNNPYTKDTVYNFTANATDSLLINIIDSLSPTCPPMIEKVGYRVDTLTDKDTGSLIKFTVTQCNNNYLYSIKPVYTTYEFYKNNILVSTGSNASFMYTNLVNGDKLTAIGKINTCEKAYGPVNFVLNPKPTSTFNFTRNWKTYTFTATDPNLAEYKWFVGSTSLGTGSVKVADFTPYDNSTVDVKLVTKTVPGCTDSSSQSITVPKFSSLAPLQNTTFKLYPNPFGDFITIESLSDQYKVQIFNSVGQVVGAMNGTDYMQVIPTSEWAAGIYHIVITDKENQISKFTIVKQ